MLSGSSQIKENLVIVSNGRILMGVRMSYLLESESTAAVRVRQLHGVITSAGFRPRRFSVVEQGWNRQENQNWPFIGLDWRPKLLQDYNFLVIRSFHDRNS